MRGISGARPAAALLALLSLSLLAPILLFPSHAAALTPHAPIKIASNAEFTAANGVVGGTGTPSNPYIIEGWDITASSLNGIQIENTDAFVIVRNVAVHSGISNLGIVLRYLANAVVENATVAGMSQGVILIGTNLAVSNSTVTGSYFDGITMRSTGSITISGNNISANTQNGIHIANSGPTTVVGNYISANGRDGLEIDESRNATVLQNTFVRDGIALRGVALASFNSHAITPDNTANGLPILYYKDCANLDIDGRPAGQLLVANCRDVHVRNLTIRDTDMGIGLALVDRVVIEENSITGTRVGIALTEANSFLLSSNNVSGGSSGIRVEYSTNGTVRGNSVSSCEFGVVVETYSQNVTVDANSIVLNSPMGLIVDYSTDIVVAANVITGGTWVVYVRYSGRVAIEANQLTASMVGLFVESSQDVMIRNNSATGSDIEIDSSLEVAVQENAMSLAGGLTVKTSTNVSVWGNTFSDNSPGVELFVSTGVRVYHNNFVNTQGYEEGGSLNAWDLGYPAGGNYWSGYAGLDDCSGPLQDVCPDPDGIGDTPRQVDSDTWDRYPFIDSRPEWVAPSSPTLLSADLMGPGFGDMRLSWSRSSDEGHAGGTVAYRVLRSSNLTGTYRPVGSVPANGSALYASVCPGCGHNESDVNTYFFKVQAVDAANNTADLGLAAKYARRIVAGWNLIGVPVGQTDASVNTVLQTFGWDIARTYRSSDLNDPWKANYASHPGDLASAQLGDALWVNATGSGILTLAGLVLSTPTFPLRSGWNLIAYGAFVPEARALSLAEVPGVGVVQTFDPVDQYRVRIVPSDELLLPGEAYWIFVVGAGGAWVQG